MRKQTFVLCLAIVSAMTSPTLVRAQTASPTTPSQSNSGGNAAAISPSGGTAGTSRAAVGSPGAPAIGGNTTSDLTEQKKNDQQMTICKGC